MFIFNQTENRTVTGKIKSESYHFWARKLQTCDLFPLRAPWTQEQNCDRVYIKAIEFYIYIYIYIIQSWSLQKKNWVTCISLNLYFVILVSIPVPIIGYADWNISFSFLGPHQQISEHCLNKTTKYSFQIFPNSSSVSQFNFSGYYLLTDFEFLYVFHSNCPLRNNEWRLGFNYEKWGLS